MQNLSINVPAVAYQYIDNILWMFVQFWWYHTSATTCKEHFKMLAVHVFVMPALSVMHAPSIITNSRLVRAAHNICFTYHMLICLADSQKHVYIYISVGMSLKCSSQALVKLFPPDLKRVERAGTSFATTSVLEYFNFLLANFTWLDR